MSRRLEELTDRTIEESGERPKKAFEDAGFSEELKKQLEERIEMSKFKSDNAAAFAQVDLPVWSSVQGMSGVMGLLIRSRQVPAKAIEISQQLNPGLAPSRLKIPPFGCSTTPISHYEVPGRLRFQRHENFRSTLTSDDGAHQGSHLVSASRMLVTEHPSMRSVKTRA